MNWVRLIALSVSASLFFSCGQKLPVVTWTEGEPDGGNTVHCFTISPASALGEDWEIWFSQITGNTDALEGSGALIEQVQGNTYRIYPNPEATPGDTVKILYRSIPLKRNCWAPEGFVLRNSKGQYPLEARYNFLVTEEQLPEKTWRKPDFSTPGHPLAYRGYMLDVSRNFTPKDEVIRLLDTLAAYRVNYFQFHFADDEGWRLEVEGIPELTSVGAFHALPTMGPDGKWQELTALQPSYDGCADRNDTRSLANGYYTKAEFIEIIQHAKELGITVIPEIDTPGHSRAAIISMEAYCRRTGDDSMRLRIDDDPSVYVTAQGYNDNILPVDRESVYTFLYRVWDYVIDIYREADVPLPVIHIGGDEVPRGVWAWSDNPTAMRSYYIGRMADYAASRGVKIAGWQEIVQGLDEESFAKLKEVLFGINCWKRVSTEMIADMRERGIPIIISDAKYTYADQAYSSAKTELGHSWAGYISPELTYEYTPDLGEGVLGIQVQFFAETLRNTSEIYYHTFPKMLGIFDLAWNGR